MLRGCLLFLSSWICLSAVYIYALSHALEMKPAAIAGGVVGFLVLCLFGALRNAWSVARFNRLLDDAQRFLPREDGQEMAVCGTIHPKNEPVRAPFTGEPCVLCEYSVRRADYEEQGSRDTSPHSGVDFSGYLMNPCVIRSTLGDVALFGFPQLDGFSDEIATLPGQVRRAREFVESTEFENVSGVRIVGAVSSLNQVFADEDGAVSRHFRIGKNTESLFARSEAFSTRTDAEVEREREEAERDDERWDAEAATEEHFSADAPGPVDTPNDGDLFDASSGIPQLAETRVPVGAPVCAMGVYSAEHKALATASGLRTVLTRLYHGRPAEVGERLKKQYRHQLAIGLLGLLFIHGILAGILFMSGLEQ